MNFQNVSKNEDFDSQLQKFIDAKNKKTPNELELRNLLASMNLPIVERSVKKQIANLPKSITAEDCFQEGFLGLLKAFERFNPAKNPNFQAWATHNIKYAILDYLRNNDEFSRKLRTFIKNYKKAKEKLEALLFRTPTEEEIFAKLDINRREYQKYKIYTTALQTLSLDEMFGNSENDNCLSRLDIEVDKSSDDPVYSTLEKEIVFDSFHKLTFNERIILALLYVEKLKQKQIAEILELSEGRVSQIINGLILKLTD